MTRRLRAEGFSLVEVLLALGVAAFALIPLLALLPAGMQTNRASVQEDRAVDLLTLIASDLRNSSTANGKSQIFGFTAPYVLNAGTGRATLNPVLQVSAALTDGATTIGLKSDDTIVSIATLPSFQASVIYSQLPAAGALRPVQARVIVNWPCRNLTNPTSLTDLTQVTGYVEAYITFPSP